MIATYRHLHLTVSVRERERERESERERGLPYVSAFKLNLQQEVF